MIKNQDVAEVMVGRGLEATVEEANSVYASLRDAGGNPVDEGFTLPEKRTSAIVEHAILLADPLAFYALKHVKASPAEYESTIVHYDLATDVGVPSTWGFMGLEGEMELLDQQGRFFMLESKAETIHGGTYYPAEVVILDVTPRKRQAGRVNIYKYDVKLIHYRMEITGKDSALRRKVIQLVFNKLVGRSK